MGLTMGAGVSHWSWIAEFASRREINSYQMSSWIDESIKKSKKELLFEIGGRTDSDVAVAKDVF